MSIFLKRAFYLTPFLLATCTLFALPEGGEVAAGHAEIQSADGRFLKITASEKAIVNFQKFNVGEGEHVEFIQPSPKSTILSRIKGKDPSQILGKLSANGRVFLVNPSGIYFGPKATVNAGSFLASTLNIRDEDFLNDKFEFFLEPGAEKASIINEGTISANSEGFVGLFSSFIENRGSILARAGKIALAAGQRVTLDFSGDGLIQFTVDGDLKQALIENYGQIEAASGAVEISLRTAKDAIKMVVNTDGMTPANAIEESNGVIRLVSKSHILGEKIHIEGTQVGVEGAVNGSAVHILGDEIRLTGAEIHATGDAGGGTVLIGGDYQGKGGLRTAQFTMMDNGSTIYADAKREGDGGKVILWADGTTLFDGKIFARGGELGGNGGFVETSGKEELGIASGFVDTSAPMGNFGNWLLDPSSITIATGGGATLAQCTSPQCGNAPARTIAPATIAVAASNVALCAQNAVGSSITVTNAISMNNPGVSLSLTAGSTNLGPINLNNSITTRGGAITLNGVVTLGAASTLNTTNATPAGANITFSNTVDGAQALTLNGGTGGIVTLTGAVGGTTPLTNLSFTSASLIQIGSNITVTGANPLIFPSPVSLTGPSLITSNNANITFSSTLNGGQALNLAGGTGITTFTGAVGGTTPLTSLTVNAGTITQSSTVKTTGAISYTAGTINLGGNVTTSGGTIGLTGPVILNANLVLDSTNAGAAPAGANITASSTINGARDLNFTAGTGGIVTLGGAVGGTTPLTNLIFTSASLIQIGSNITVTGANPLVFTSPVSLTGPSTITSNNANITFNSTLNGAQALTLVGGTGTTTFTGAVGGTTPLTSLTVNAATITQSSSVKTTGPVSYTAGAINIGGNITTSGGTIGLTGPVSLTANAVLDTTNGGATPSGASITASSTINGARDLTLNGGTGGTVTLTGAVGGITPLSSLVVTGSTITQSSTINTTGTVIFNGSSAVNVNGNVTTAGGEIVMNGPVITTATSFDTTNGGATPVGANVHFTSTLNGATALTVNGGLAGNVTFSGAVGGITPFASLNATGFTVTQSSSAKVVGALTYSGSTGISVGGNITTSGAAITLNGPVVISGNPTFDSTNAGAFAGANISFSDRLNGATALTLRAGTGNTIFTGSVGGITPLTNLTFTSANLIRIGSNMTVSGANPLTFPFPVVLFGTSNITSNNANISFNSTINGDAALTRTLRLAAGSGSVTLTGAVGGTTTLQALTISSANNATANAITVGALGQSAGTGTTTFNGVISTSDGLGINLTGSAFTFNNTVTTTGGGGVSIANSGLLTIPFGSTFTLDGPFAQTGLGAVRAGDTITSNNGILFTGPVALTHAASFSTAAASQLIEFKSSIDSLSTTPFDLTLDAGTSSISILGNIGSIHPLGAFFINQANNVDIQGIVANSLTVNGGTGTSTVNGNMTIGSGGVTVTGNNFASNGNVNVTGSVTITNSGTVTRAPGHTTVVGGNYSILGTGPAFAGSSLTVGGNVLITPAVTLVSNATVDTSAGGGNITFVSTINATRDFTLNAGTGNITLGGNVGFSVPVGNLTIGSATTVSTQGIQATSIRQLSGSGTTTFNGALTTTGALGVSINTNSIVRGAAITTTGGGPVTITNNVGDFTSTAAGAISAGGAFSQSGGLLSTVTLKGTITTANANLSFASPITMTGTTSLNSGTGVGSITLSQTVQGAFDLTLNSGSGNITLGGNVGTLATPLTGFTITNAATVLTKDIFSSFITQSNGSVSTTFNGSLNTTAASGISLTGKAFTFNDTFTTTPVGSVTLTNTGLATFSSGATGSIAGSLTQNGTGSVQLSSTITAGGAMQFNGPFSVLGTGSLDTQAANQPITFFSTLDGPGDLTLSTGSANILISGDAGGLSPLGDLTIATAFDITTGAITASSITMTATGTTLFNDDLLTSGSPGIDLTGEAFTFLGNATASTTGSITIANGSLLTTTAGTTLSGAAGFSQTGIGLVNLGSGISASNADISFVSPITLVSDVILNSGTTAGDITVDTVDGNYNLTFTAGRDITAGVIGGTTRLGTVKATTVRNNTASSITAGAIVQLAGSGTTSLTGNIDTNTPAGINLTGTNFSRSGAIITTNGGSFVVTNTGTITGTSINTTSIDGSYTQIGVGPLAKTDLAGTISARLGISLSSPITLISNLANTIPIILDTSGGNGNISVTGTINNNVLAPHTLILRSGSGNTSLSGSIGNTAPIGPIQLGNINDFTAGAITADSIQQEALTTLSGLATFNGAITTSGASGIVLDGNAFTFNANVTTSGGGAVALTNSGLLTIASSSAFSLDSTFTQSGTGSVSFGGSIVTTNDAISFGSPMLLTAPASLNSGAGAGDITLSGTLNGASTLQVTSGTGNVSFQSSIGQTTPVSGLTVTSASTSTLLVNANAALSGPFTSTAGPTTFNGTLDASTVTLTGSSINFNNAVTTSSGSIGITNSGTLTVASSSPITSNTSFTQTGAGTVSLGSNITTTGVLSIASSITLTDNITLDSQGGNLTLSDTVAGLFDLTLAAGIGDITISGNIGAPRIDVFTITSAKDISVQAITAASINLISSTGTATLVGNLDTDAIAGISLVGNNFTSSGTVTTTNGGPLVLTNSGLVTATGASVITLDGAFTQNGTGLVHLGGTVTTQNANISHSSPVQVLLPATFTSNGGNIVFLNTIDGPDCLTLAAGTGNVTLDGVVGGITPLGCLDASGATIFQNSSISTTGSVLETGTAAINVGGNITTTNSNITLAGNATIGASLTLSTGAGAGNISITGTVDGDAAGHNLTLQAGTGDITLSGVVGGAVTFTNLDLSAQNISWKGLGSTSIGATGTTTVNATTDLTFSGTSYSNGTQNFTAGNNFNFTAGALTKIVSNSLPITFSTGTIQLGTTDLTIQSNDGNITLTQLEGPTRNLIVDADLGNLVFTTIGSFGNDLNSVDLTYSTSSPTPVLGTNVFAGSLVINTPTLTLLSGNINIPFTYLNPVQIQGAVTFTCGASGDIIFTKSVNGQFPTDTLSIAFSPPGCTGSVEFDAPVGSLVPLASITIDQAVDVAVKSTMDVGTLSITNGTGVVTIDSGITSTAAGGISISSPTINMSGSITTASGGPVTLDSSTALTLSTGASLDIAGAFQQTGAGTVSIGGSLVTHDATIQFAGPITLTGPTTFNSHDTTGGDISFASTIKGGQNLTLESGNGDITFTGAVGTLITPLGDVKINSARNVTASNSIFASTLTQLAGSGLTSFGALTTSGLNGINLKGSAFTFNNNITTSGSGPLKIDNSGTLTFANAVYSIDGQLNQTGSAGVNLAGAFTVNGTISFAQDATLTDTTSLSTSAASQNITFNKTITNDLLGPHTLTFNAGGGNITCTGAIGATPIGAMTISSVKNGSFNAISAASLTQTAGSGSTTITGNIATSGSISLTGTNFTIDSTVTTTGGGLFSISNSGPLTLTLGNTTLIDGTFSQSGGGLVSLSGKVATNDQNLSFANAITLAGTTTLSTGSGAGDITLTSAVNGNQALTLDAGTGNISFGANLGTTTPLGALTINSVTDITYPQVKAASIVQSGSFGTTTITGPFNTTGLLGVSITGGTINQNGAITTTNAGPVSFSHTGNLIVAGGADTVAAGGYSQLLAGAVSLGGSITTTSNPISFSGTVALTADVDLIAGPTSSNSSNISFADVVTGAFALDLTAVGGSITFASDVGTLVTPLTAFTITQADTVSTQGVYADSISQLVGTGSSTFNGPLNASTASGITLAGTAFTFDDTVTSSGSLILTNSGLAKFNSGATGTITGAVTQNGTGGVQLSSAITAGGAIGFTGAVSTSGAASLDTPAINDAIRFFSTVNGSGDLTLAAGNGNITFDFNVGDTSRLGALTITSVIDLAAHGIKAASIAQTAGTGLSLFDADLDTNGLSGIDLGGTTFTFLGNITSTGGGPVTLTNSGTLTTTSGKTISSNGIFTQNGSGSVQLGCTITTTNPLAANADINFSGTSPISLTAPASLDSSIGGGTINFTASNTVVGNQPFTLTAGAGNINALGNFGTVLNPLGDFTVVSVNDGQFQAIRAKSITQSAGSGTSSLLGLLDTSTPDGITLIGNKFFIGPLAASITTTNGGSLTITNQGLISGSGPLVITLDGSLIQNGPGAVVLTSATARQGISFTGPGILAASTTFDTSGGNGDISFGEIISGIAGTETLTLNAGTGNITLSKPLGTVTVIDTQNVMAIGSITAGGRIISINDIGTALSPGVTGTTSLTASDEMIFTGTTYNANTQTYSATTHFNMDGGALTTFSSGANPLTFQGGGVIQLSTGTDLTLNTVGTNITVGNIRAATGNHRHLIMNAGVGSIQAGNLGILGGGEFASASYTAANLTLGDQFADAFTFNYTGTLNAGGDIVSTNTALSFPKPVVLQGTNIFATGGTTSLAGITFSDTLNGAAPDIYGLTLNAGAGNILFSGNVGVPNRLLNLIIGSAGNVTLDPGTSMRVDALIQSSGSGTTTFNGSLLVPGVLGIQLTGNNFAFNNGVTTLNNASLTVTNSGTINFAGTATLSGAFTQASSTGPVTLSGTITAGQPILFSGPVTLSGSPSLNTSVANETITFQNTVGGNGNITLAAGNGGDIFLDANMGSSIAPVGAITINSSHYITAQSVFAQSLNLVSSTGIATVNGTLSTVGAAGINLIGNNFFLNGALTTTGGGSVVVTNSGLITGLAASSRTVDGSYTQNGTGPVNFAGSLATLTGPISFASPLTLLGPSVFNSSAANQDITFLSTIDGPSSLSVTAGGGDVFFIQVVGGNVALSGFTVNSADHITLNGVGLGSNGVAGTLNLNASHDINFPSTIYSATSQFYSAGHSSNFTAGTETTLTSFGGPIAFTGGPIDLSAGTDLKVITNNGSFSYTSIVGTNLEKVTVNAGTGVASLNTVSGIQDLVVEAGKILLLGPMNIGNINLVSLTTIANSGLPVLILTSNNASFNALGGDVGTLSSPIFVQTLGKIFAGADGSPTSLAAFSGTSSDNTVQSILTTPPCKIVFNNVVIKDCTIPPVPPVPPTPPTPPVPPIPGANLFPFAVPGFDSSFFNLASDFYFFPYFFDECYICRCFVIDWRAPPKCKKVPKRKNLTF